MLHLGDTVEEIATKRKGRIDSTRVDEEQQTPQWGVFFSDGKRPLVKYFLNAADLRLVTCPHLDITPGFVPARGIMGRAVGAESGARRCVGGIRMEVSTERRARKLVDILESGGSDCGLLVIKGAVVMRCPGAPFTDLPIPYDEADLNNAIELNLIERQKKLIGSVTGSSGWEW